MFRTPLRVILAALVAVGVLAIAPVSPASADTFVVSDPSDNVATPNTLRWAIDQAGNDPAEPTIHIDPGLSIDLTCFGGGALDYDSAANHPLTIIGNGATINQQCGGEAVLTSMSDDLVITGATLTGGTAGGISAGGDVRVEDSVIEGNTGGAGIMAYTGVATVVRSILRDNKGGAGGGVGAIHVEVQDSTVEGNTADNGGGVWSDQTSTVTNSTITGNEAANSGGGIFSTLSDISLMYTTIVENTAPEGSNVVMDFAADFTSFAAAIGSPLGGGTNCLLDGGTNVASLGSNVTSDDSCELDSGAGDLPNTDPKVGPLADNGGPTPTRLPADDSPLLDAADCAGSGVTADQRGVSRPQGAACDAGSVEVEVVTTCACGQPEEQSRPATGVALTPRFTG